VVDYEDFIQTDASINPALWRPTIDTEGDWSETTLYPERFPGGAWESFCRSYQHGSALSHGSHYQDGKVVRGYLGVYVQPVTADV